MTVLELVERIREDLQNSRRVWVSLSEDHATATAEIIQEDGTADEPTFYGQGFYTQLILDAEAAVESVHRLPERSDGLAHFPAWLCVTITDNETEQELFDVLLDIQPGDEQYVQLDYSR